MAMTNVVYSGLDVILTINGTRITGAESLDDAYSIEMPERVETISAMHGGGVANINTNTSGTLKVKLMAVHEDNDFMAILYQSLNLGGRASFCDVYLSKNGGDLVFSGEFLVQGAPPLSAGNKVEPREWTLVSPSVFYNPGAMGGH